MNKFFNATHSPVGAFSTFTLGYKGSSGGFCSFLGKPADQKIYIGFGGGDEYKFLPFFDFEEENQQEDFTLESSFPLSSVKIDHYEDEDIIRKYNIGTDEFLTEDFKFTIHTPQFKLTKSDREKLEICPSVICKAQVENTSNDIKYFIFGSDKYDQEVSFRHVSGGIAQGLGYMIGTNDKDSFSSCQFSLEDMLNPLTIEHINNKTFMLAENGCIITKIPPHSTKQIVYSVSFYKGGNVTSGITCKMKYTKYFKDIVEVSKYSLEHAHEYINESLKLNAELSDKPLTEEQSFQIALTTNNYFSSSELLIDENDSDIYVVNEGEFRMMNTLDLCVDHMFFELSRNPWVVKKHLEFYYEKYSYVDEINVNGTLVDGGISFCHDYGNINQFSKEGTSSYEITDLTECFSYMTFEQLVNYMIIFGTYIINQEDYVYLSSSINLFYDLIESLFKRTDESGFLKYNSSKVGIGSEITTYDSLDASLGQSIDSTYILSKSFAAIAIFNELCKSMEDFEMSKKLESRLGKINNSIESCVFEGIIKSHLDSTSTSYIIPVAEGLVYLYYLGLKNYYDINGKYGNYIKRLKSHSIKVLQGPCIFDNGGYRLSSTSKFAWLSKIYISMFIHEKIFNIDSSIIKKANTQNVEWLTSTRNSYYAYTDQMYDFKAQGSKYYPRGVTSILWTL